eukprot:403342071
MKRILFTTLTFAAAVLADDIPCKCDSDCNSKALVCFQQICKPLPPSIFKTAFKNHERVEGWSCFGGGCGGNLVCHDDGNCYLPEYTSETSQPVKGWVCTPGKCGHLVCHDDGMCYPYMQQPVQGHICTQEECGPDMECRNDGRCWLSELPTTANNEHSPIKGVMCGSDINCDYNYKCMSGTCIYSPPPHFQTEQLLKCGQPSDCPEAHKCHEGLCRSPLGLACKSDSQCGTKFCIRGTCQNKTLEQTQ